MSPYNLQHYVAECEGTQVEDYVVLAHSGHGVNSYAIQYYLVQRPLRTFLHLGWGGVYMSVTESAAAIRECFSMTDQIVVAAHRAGRLEPGGRLMIVGSDFYGSYWVRPEESGKGEGSGRRGPLEVLTEALDWLMERQ